MKRLVLSLLLISLVATALATVPPAPPSSATFTCTGSVGPYPFTFPITDPTAMTVIQNGTTLSSANYTITPVNNNYNNGGNVTLSVACPNGQSLLLQRITPQTQIVKFYDNMPIPMSTFENGLDKLTEISQEIWAYGVMHWKGTWSATTIYTLNDAVSYNGSAYISLNYFNLGNTPDSSPAQWSLMLAGGSQVVGPISGVTIGFPVAAAGQFTVLNGVINPTTYTGSDIGAKINAAISANSCGPSNCLLQLPPGVYSFSTAITIPANTTLDCGASGGWSSVQEPSPTATTLSYTGSGDAITLSGVQSAVRNCSLTVGSSATSGVKMTAGQTTVSHGYLIGGGASTKLININCGGPGCEKPELDFVDFYGYTGQAVYCANANDMTMTNLTGYAAAGQITSVAVTIDSQCNGAKSTRGSFGGSGLHQLVFSDTLTTGAPTWAMFDLFEADCARGGAGILFDSTLDGELLHARITSGWAAGSGQNCAAPTSAPITISPGIQINGGIGILIQGAEIRANTGDGILINSASATNIQLISNKIWGNNFKYRSLGGDNGDYNGIRLTTISSGLIVTANELGNYPGNLDGHQHYGIKISQANPLNTVVTGNNFGDNTLGSYIYPVALANVFPMIYGNTTPNTGADPKQVMTGDLSVQSLTVANIAPHVIPNYGTVNSFAMGFGVNWYFDGTNWHLPTDGTSNGGCSWLGDQGGTVRIYCAASASPSADQTIAPASLSTKQVASITSAGIFDAKTGFSVGGVAGFTGTKTAGSCVLTIVGGIITNVTGC